MLGGGVWLDSHCMGQCQAVIPSRGVGGGVWAVASVQWDFYVSPGSRRVYGFLW